MKKILVRSALSVLGLAVLLGGVAAYMFLSQERGMTRDGRLAPPASVGNAPEAPKYDAAKSAAPTKTTEQPPEYQMPTDFKFPTDVDITPPKVPEGLGTPADGAKS